MKANISILFVLIVGFLLSSCEDIVTLKTPSSDHYMVIEATLTNLPGPQKIILTRSQDYFDNSVAPKIAGASVSISDNEGREYLFKESKTELGSYIWTPTSPTDIFGKVGRTFKLTVKSANETFMASETMRRVPPIDSILYQYDEANQRQGADGKPKNGYDAQFYARDPIGVGDCFRVKTYKNKKLFNGTENLVFFYDAAFQKGAMADGLMFILPIRRSISPELYQEKDTIKVELYSISEGQFNFYSQARFELNNAGLFSRPAANIPTNFINVNPNSSLQGAGWFGVSAISMFETIVDSKKARKNIK
jgi:hypothetical protein